MQTSEQNVDAAVSTNKTTSDLASDLRAGRKRLSVAPMIDWTTSDFRVFARLFNPYAHLYTEMISTSAVLKGDRDRLLGFCASETPLVLQLGGSNPSELALCAQYGEAYGYSAINLNVGCPSDRVQYNRIGACLMAEPKVVAAAVAAMKQSCRLPVSVKHRLGIDRRKDYAFARDFVACIAEAGCEHIVVHARNAWLDGLSPKQNREIPPLRYEDVYRLKQDFPHLFVEINGGIKTITQIKEHLRYVDGVMIGREAYHNPLILAQALALWGQTPPTSSEVFERFVELLRKAEQSGAPLHTATRHYLGMFAGAKGSRRWRQTLSGQKTLSADQIERAGRAVLAANAGI